MKFPVKLLYLLSLAGFGGVIALMWYLMIADPVPAEKLADDRWQEVSPTQKILLDIPFQQELTRWQEGNFSPLDRLNTPEEKLITETAEKSVLALLPVNSFIIRRNPVKLLGEHLAEASGQAGSSSDTGKAKTLWNYRIKIRFFPQGYAEADFPEIEPLQPR